MDPPVNHSDYEELAAGFALGALEPDEEQAFERHLEGCPACKAGVRELEELSGRLAYAVAPVEPPASLRAAIRRRTGLTVRRRMLNDGTASRVALSGPATQSGARATVLASSPQDRGVLVVEALPEPPQGRVYELWSLPLGDVAHEARAAVFRFRGRAGVRAVEFSVPIQPTTAFAITDEPGPRGSDHPTTAPVLQGAPGKSTPGYA